MKALLVVVLAPVLPGVHCHYCRVNCRVSIGDQWWCSDVKNPYSVFTFDFEEFSV